MLNEQTVLSIPALPSIDIDREGLSLLLRHPYLPNDLNGCGADNDFMCIVQRHRLLLQDRTMT